jgi:hypothetical protein
MIAEIKDLRNGGVNKNFIHADDLFNQQKK